MSDSSKTVKNQAASIEEHGKFIKIIHLLSRFSGAISAAMIVASVIITCEMIFVRFVLNQSTIWQTETVVYLMIAATLLGLPYVQLLRGHVNVDLIPLMLRPKPRMILQLLSLTLSIVIVAIMAFYGFELFHTAWTKGWKSDTVWGVRMWIPYLALPVGLTLYMLQLIADSISILNNSGNNPNLVYKDIEGDS